MFNEMIIHKSNLINNIKQVKGENQNSKICAMVKANAYGVGLNEVVLNIDKFVDFYGVACFFEAKNVSKLTKRPILIVGSLEKDCVDKNFSYTCSTLDDIEFLTNLNCSIKIHLKINTGMNRFGFKDIREFKKALRLIKNSCLIFEGIFTHFATADEKVVEQMNLFLKFVNVARSFGFNPIVHADNSIVNEKFNHHLDMVRIGFNLFNRENGWFVPVVEIKSRIAQVQSVKKGELVGYDYRFVAKKNMKVAVIPFGYADGFDLKYIGKNIDVAGETCSVLNICMDCFMLDITNVDVKKGDEIYLVNKFNSLNSYAEYAETSVYEVMCKFSHARVDRTVI